MTRDAAIVVLFMFVVVCLGVLAFVLPNWLSTRQKLAAARERIDALRGQLAGSQAMLDTSRQQLLRCREQVIARNLEDLGKRDAS